MEVFLSYLKPLLLLIITGVYYVLYVSYYLCSQKGARWIYIPSSTIDKINEVQTNYRLINFSQSPVWSLVQIHKFYLVDSLILCLKCRLSAMLFTWYNSIHGWPKLTSKMSLFRCHSIMAITNTWNAAGITFYIIQSCQMDVTQQ